MQSIPVTCLCGHVFHVFTERDGTRSVRCPRCGNLLEISSKGKAVSSQVVTDSYTDAAYEVLAEEGAIWSGAR